MDLQKAANWSQVIGTILAAIALTYIMWDHLPTTTATQSIGVGWGAAMKVYVAPAIIALILFASAVLQTIASRRRHSPPQTASETDTSKPTIEILSPFDNDEVGLFETVRGRVFPPDQDLQVVVFAGDKKWYPQKPVSVKGSTWSAKCQFGNLEIPSGGSYRVVALLGNELKGGMWYSELPIGIPQSNSITVHRPQATTEHELKTARSERDEYKRRFQLVTNAFTNMEEQVDKLTADKTTLERELLTVKKEKQDVELRFNTTLQQSAISKSDTQVVKPTSIVPCGEELLHNFADSDRGWIDKAVTIVSIDPQPDDLTRSAPYIDFVFHLFNNSVFPVTIEDSVTGRISFREMSHSRELDQPLSLRDNEAKELLARCEAKFTIRQHLLKEEVNSFRDNKEVRFYFNQLSITIKGCNQSDKVIAQRLDTSSKSCGVMERYLYYEPQAALAYANMPYVQVAKLKAELEEEKKKTKPDIHGEIKEVWFEKEVNLETSLIVSQDCYFYYWFYLRVYVANYGAATTIERYRLLLKSKDGIHEGHKASLKGYSLRNAINEHLIVDDLSDIEDQNDVALEHTRNGWLCFAVPSIKSNNDNGAVEDAQIEIQVIDKTKMQHSISRSVQAEWQENTQHRWPRINPSRTNWPRQN